MQEKGAELIGVQYLRGIAALLVVLDHVSGMTELKKYFGTSVFNNAFGYGYIGVDLFFVISGFIIAYISLSGGDLQPRISPKNYLLRRIVRIFPFLWVSVIGYAFLRWLSRDIFDPAPYLRALTLYPVGSVKPNVVWTLRHEVLFYLMFLWILFSPRMGVPLLVAWLLSPFLIFSSGYSEWINFFCSPINILFGFGLLAGVLFLKGRLPFIKLSYGITFTLCASIALLYLASYFSYSRNNLIDVVLMGSACATVIFCGARIKYSEYLTQPARALRLLGDASYAIYLTHEAVISMFLGVLAHKNYSLNLNLQALFIVIMALVFGVAVHKLVERPLVTQFRKLIQ